MTTENQLKVVSQPDKSNVLADSREIDESNLSSPPSPLTDPYGSTAECIETDSHKISEVYSSCQSPSPSTDPDGRTEGIECSKKCCKNSVEIFQTCDPEILTNPRKDPENTRPQSTI